MSTSDPLPTPTAPADGAPTRPMLTLIVNAAPREVPQGSSVRFLIESLGLGQQAVAAEVNGVLVPRRQHEACLLAADDRVELVTLVGGG